jgi:Tol biopolymer transport system component
MFAIPTGYLSRDGDQAIQLNHNKRSNDMPTWSPDGNKLAFHAAGLSK